MEPNIASKQEFVSLMTTAWENEDLMRKKARTKWLYFSENRCFGVMKNQKIYRDPKKLSDFENGGKSAFI